MKYRATRIVGGGGYHLPRSSFSLRSLCFILAFVPLLFGCQPDDSMTIAFLGDISLGRDVTPGLESFAYLQDDLTNADIVLANLESPLGSGIDESSPGYNLCAPGEYATLLAEWGIDLLSLANNHVNDCFPKGIPVTRSLLGTAGLTGLGSEAYQVKIEDINVTFFAFDDISSEMDMEAATTAISAASNRSFVIVSMHWGTEYHGAPSQRQEYLAGILAEAGAGILWGHHPHVLQSVEWIETSSGGTLVLYSLGNALFDQGGLADTRQSALLLVNLDGGRVRSVEAVPFEINVPLSILKSPSTKANEEILLRLAIPNDLIPNR